MSYSLYEPLVAEPPSIRLLILLKGSQQDPIQCRLQLAHLGDEPEYEALSYTWGDPSSTQPIQAKSVIVWLGSEESAAPHALRPYSFFAGLPALTQFKTTLNDQLPEDLLTSSFSQLHIDDGESKHSRRAFMDDTVLLAFSVLYMLPQDAHILALVKQGTMKWNATVKLIRGSRNFDILCGIQARWSDHRDLHTFIQSHISPTTKILTRMIEYNRTHGPYLPSWVPDFQAPTPYHHADRQAKLLLTNCMSITDVPIEVHDSYILSANSLRIDYILDAGPVLFVPPGYNSEARGILTETLLSAHVFKDWSSAAKTMKYFRPDKYPLGGGTFEYAFMKTLCAGVKWFRQPHGNRRSLFILEMGMGDGAYRSLEDTDFANFKSWEDWVPNHQHLSLPEYAQQRRIDETHIRNLNKAIVSTFLGRRFFITSKGYIGVGPPGMKVGDLIYVPFGSRTPFVVRSGGIALLSDKGL
ncbi:hypothetical protein GGR58DRAFT_505656 [Xylaria digitata]|nr:hypothetical protein GGR58DRAFT_505656 [Xylaria digitata]